MSQNDCVGGELSLRDLQQMARKFESHLDIDVSPIITSAKDDTGINDKLCERLREHIASVSSQFAFVTHLFLLVLSLLPPIPTFLPSPSNSLSHVISYLSARFHEP